MSTVPISHDETKTEQTKVVIFDCDEFLRDREYRNTWLNTVKSMITTRADGALDCEVAFTHSKWKQFVGFKPMTYSVLADLVKRISDGITHV